ncbi:N-acetylglutamate synthase [Whalleya microplaca]|nr:N-acetylglutamate synthase [Whalleya microplaca]
MTLRHVAWKKASSKSSTPLSKDLVRSVPGPSSLWPVRNLANVGGKSVAFDCSYASISQSQKRRKSHDRDFLVSVLETSVTKRDAKAYMNKFVPLLQKKSANNFKQGAPHTRQKDSKIIEPANDATQGAFTADSIETIRQVPQGLKLEELGMQDPLYVALIKFRAPQEVNDITLDGVGKTISQLRKLGLTSIIVVDCGDAGEDQAAQRQITAAQANRIAMAIDNHDGPGARVIDSPITIGSSADVLMSPFISSNLFVGNSHDLMSALREEVVPIIPPYGYTSDTCLVKPVNANDAILALTRKLSGLQFLGQSSDNLQISELLRAAEVYRLVVLDPLGGTPAKNRATRRHMYLNLEQEFQDVEAELTSSDWPNAINPKTVKQDNWQHLDNVKLTKNVLTLLPPTSSAVITTPQEVAKERGPEDDDMDCVLVGTRRGQNPLIHSLLTDKPVQSSSLPTERFRTFTSPTGTAQIGSLTTLAKKGMPLTVFPDPRVTRWKPPQPGERRLNLTDPCIDLPRLVNLIEDSFGRKLDVDHYLKRINGNLAGIIIAGEYEGGAILTWEKPPGVQGSEADDISRLVPYLDKFAVLRRSQGAGGVADIVFNAMVRGCLTEGVCWRSRKDNPVNKWYFERSRGSLKFADMNWTMFWTTPDLALDGQKFRDYESVCRGIEPSWADKKRVLD